MAQPNYTINLNSTLQAGASVGAGQFAVTGSGGTYLPATAANRAGGKRSSFMALGATNPSLGANFAAQSHGDVDAAVSGLAAGTASWVRVSATGYAERVTVPVVADDVVGWCETTGVLHLSCGILGAFVTEDGVPSGTGLRHVVSGVEDAAASLLVNADVSASAAVAVTKLAAGTDGQVLRNVAGTNSWGAVPGLTPPAGANTSAQYRVDATAFGGATGLTFPFGTYAQVEDGFGIRFGSAASVDTDLFGSGTTAPKTLWLPDVSATLAALTQVDSALAGAQDDLDAGVAAGCTVSLYFTAGATQPTGFVAPLAGGIGRLEIFHPNGITGANEDAASLAVNRMINWPEVAGAEVPMTTATLVYNTTLQRWVVIQAQVLV